MSTKFTERDTERYYDAQDAIYRSIWDEEGSVHWGIFDQSTGQDFLKGCANLNKIMVEKAGINGTSKLLDLGCGNGTTAMWLCKALGCKVTGVDLSSVRIGNARKALHNQPHGTRMRLGFEKASATDLPFGDGSFTHVWSQAVIYHIHDKERALSEVYRVLQDDGIFVFDDLTRLKPDISEMAREYVYERLYSHIDFSFESYQDALKKAGFRVLDAQDISHHLETSYRCLAKITRENGHGHSEKYQALALAYERSADVVGNGELGWGLYLCQK